MTYRTVVDMQTGIVTQVEYTPEEQVVADVEQEEQALTDATPQENSNL
jgi:hypothetical protein